MTRPRRRCAADRPRAARVQARGCSLPVRPAGRDRAGTVRRRRPPVPDPVLRDLPVTSSRRSRGSRPRAASSAGPAPSRPTRRSAGASTRPRGAAVRPELAAARARRGVGRLDAHGGSRSSACTRTPRSRSPGPATSSATGSSPSCPLSARVLLYSVTWTSTSARHQWQDGIRRVESMRADDPPVRRPHGAGRRRS